MAHTALCTVPWSIMWWHTVHGSLRESRLIFAALVYFSLYSSPASLPLHTKLTAPFARGLEGWKALQIACTVHIQAACLIFWQSFSSIQCSLKSVCPWFCTASLCSSVTPDDVKAFCGGVPDLEDSIVRGCCTLAHISPSISDLRNKCSATRELLEHYTEEEQKPTWRRLYTWCQQTF